MTGSFKNILLDAQGGVAVLTVNRPDKLNALSIETLHELKTAVEAIISNNEIRAAIVTGSGQKAFISGADISEFVKMNATDAKNFAELGQSVLNMMECGGKPFIAAINGYALGGGCELALACAIRIASENAKLGQPEVKLGIMTGFGGSQRLVRVVGKARAMELCLLGGQIDAQTALQWGLVSRVFPQAQLMDEARKMAAALAAGAPLALRYTMEAINKAADVPLDEGLLYEANLFGLCFATEDKNEGTTAFLQKRAPQFKGK